VLHPGSPSVLDYAADATLDDDPPLLEIIG